MLTKVNYWRVSTVRVHSPFFFAPESKKTCLTISTITTMTQLLLTILVVLVFAGLWTAAVALADYLVGVTFKWFRMEGCDDEH